ncbi:hypothetical protein BRADI_5g08633v3 [Brachypodium distachyon]|uniref:Secreted protein n=1 Tax=Brachypodium distachyon TaxID=15368 RepID=A0A2K2CG03_BRADI|nr:hypothetical protein BRADI_5g08633v3 [Brachypodium distachyon]
MITSNKVCSCWFWCPLFSLIARSQRRETRKETWRQYSLLSSKTEAALRITLSRENEVYLHLHAPHGLGSMFQYISQGDAKRMACQIMYECYIDEDDDSAVHCRLQLAWNPCNGQRPPETISV